MMRQKQPKSGQGKVIVAKSNAITASAGGTCDMSAPAPKTQDL